VIAALRSHWPEYLMEAFGLGAFMVSACLVTALFEYPPSFVHAALPDPTVRRALIGVAMGMTAIAIIYSPWGKRSGAHLNPAVTLTFFRLRRIGQWDAAFYVVAQVAGGTLGVLFSLALFPAAVMHPAVNYVITTPGAAGVAGAFVGEVIISFTLMVTVLTVSGSRAANWTGIVAGTLVAAYITFEAPYSGMSMNPARTAASSIASHDWSGWWVYLLAPTLAMLAAAEVYVRTAGWARVACAKLQHTGDVRCIFCGFVPRENNQVSRGEEEWKRCSM
jgi:aquaporin Z